MLGYLSTCDSDNYSSGKHGASHLDVLEGATALRDVPVIVGDVRRKVDSKPIAFVSGCWVECHSRPRNILWCTPQQSWSCTIDIS